MGQTVRPFSNTLSFAPLLLLLSTLHGCVEYQLEIDMAYPPALRDAVARGDTQAVRTFLDQYPQVPKTSALVDAAHTGHTEIVQLLLERGAGVNDIQTYSWGASTWSALQLAADSGHAETVSVLLKAGANPDYKGTAGLTAMELARKKGYASIVKVLQEAQPVPVASPNAPAQPPAKAESPPPPIY